MEDLLAQIANDITVRLRVKARHVRLVLGVNENIVIDSLEDEAAKEIESLRTKCVHLESEVARLERLSNG
jgi:hypothetical protein